MNKTTCRLAGLLALLVPTVVHAAGLRTQEADDKPASARDDKVVEFADRYNARFLDREPKIGSTIADLKARDAAGNEFEFAATRGKHTVVVFGCLT